MLTLDDGRFLVFTVAMYGGILAFTGESDNPYYLGSRSKCAPPDAAFDAAHFGRLLADAKPNLSVKAFLATEQRIPGLGNGVLQDILFRAGLHPRRRIATLSSDDTDRLFASVTGVLSAMIGAGGRNTEKDLFGNRGGYAVLLSRNTLSEPCPVCGGAIRRETYLGGAVYYCPCCQPMK